MVRSSFCLFNLAGDYPALIKSYKAHFARGYALLSILRSKEYFLGLSRIPELSDQVHGHDEYRQVCTYAG